MKMFIATALLTLTTTAFAGEQHRTYTAKMKTSAGETQSVFLTVDMNAKEYSYGDPEIPGHGFYETSLSGTVYENGQSCKFESVIAQRKFDSVRTFNLSVKLCSGLELKFNSSDALLKNQNSSAAVMHKSFKNAVAQASVIFDGIEQEKDPSDD